MASRFLLAAVLVGFIAFVAGCDSSSNKPTASTAPAPKGGPTNAGTTAPPPPPPPP
jgi:hypothetical protein